MDTWIVPVLGGQPQRALTNAEGLSWIGDRSSAARVLFSEMTGHGGQMSVVTATESRANPRTVYMPPTEIGMAHRSAASPDGRWLLIVEMSGNVWLPCRLMPLGSDGPSRTVGPAPAQCTDAAWSPDGEWMYFSANTGGGTHLWRQRRSGAPPEQITFGVTEEEGIHIAADGRSLVTSIGASQSSVWVHDSHGDRQITSEGFGFQPSFSADGRKLYYLSRVPTTTSFIAGELWVVDLESGQRQRLFPDFQLRSYTVSADDSRILFTACGDKGEAVIWLASMDSRSEPRRVITMESFSAFFGAPGQIVFEGQDAAGVVSPYRIHEDGSGLEKIVEKPYVFAFANGISPDRQWIAGQDAAAWGTLFLYPTAGGKPTVVCKGCSWPQGTDPSPSDLTWSPDGRFLYLKMREADATFAIPLAPGQSLPRIPLAGFPSKDAVTALPGARMIGNADIYTGPNPSLYAFTKVATQRNVYRVPVPPS